MPTRSPDRFRRFLREHLRQPLKERGYSLVGQSALRTKAHATARLAFMRYTAAYTGRFDVRMSITVDAFSELLGVVVANDLSIHTYGSVEAAPWRWPWPVDGWDFLAANLVPAVIGGVDWLESLLELDQLAAHLEAQRRFTARADDEWAQVSARMVAAGFKTAYASAGLGKSKAGRIRPDKVKALSYCYELMEEWGPALAAWDDYLTTLSDLTDKQHPAVRKALERQEYLEGRCGR